MCMQVQTSAVSHSVPTELNIRVARGASKALKAACNKWLLPITSGVCHQRATLVFVSMCSASDNVKVSQGDLLLQCSPDA